MKTKLVAGIIVIVILIALIAVMSGRGGSREGQAAKSPVSKETASVVSHKAVTLETVKSAVDYLKKNQNEDGSWGKMQKSVGITALAVHAMLVSPLGLNVQNTPEIKKGLDYLKSQAKDTGEISDPSGMANYNTSMAIMAFKATGDSAYEPLIKKGQEFIKSLQYAENMKITPDNPIYGGIGYGSNKSRSDMSNTQWALEALKETGVSQDDPAFKKALFFLHRCQNSSEVSDTPYAAVVNDGGGLYTSEPTADDISKAGKVEVRGKVGWRSYGSMTYALVKSYIYLGLKKDSPEIKGALDWISHNWSLTENPGMPKAMEGYFYYIATFAKTHDVMGNAVVKTADGKEHRWADELIEQMLKVRQPDGSWTNSADRWFEGDPTLVTAYVLRSLSYAYKYASDTPMPAVK
jgi:squalene-hopene/tetraprenyl-beta-curcumene cyclase